MPLFEVTLSDGSTTTMQAHSETQLRLALQNVVFTRIEEESGETQKVRGQGFASLTSEKRRELGRKGGQAAQRSGKAYKFTHEAAQIAGSIGGKISRRRSKKNMGQL